MTSKSEFLPSKFKRSDISLFIKLFSYIYRQKVLLLIVLVGMILSDIFGVLPPYFLKKGLDESVPAQDLTGLYYNTLYLTLSLLGAFIFSVVFNYSSQYIGHRLIHEMRMDITKKLFSLNSEYYDKTPIGQVLTYLTNDLEAIKQFISDGVAAIIGDLLKVIFILIIMIYINPILAFFTIISVPLFAFATYLFRVSLRIGYREIRKSNAAINTILVETITGIKEITIFNHIDKSISDFEERNYNYLRSFLKVIFAYSLYFPLIEIVSFISMISILYATHLYINIEVTQGEIFAFFFYINMFFRPLRDLAEQFNTFQSAMSGAERIFWFFDTPINFDDKNAVVKEYKAKGEIVFEKVSFAYSPSEESQEKFPAKADIESKIGYREKADSNQSKNLGLAIHQVSFKIKPGEKIAIVGSTGAGKTTLISLLNRLYEVSKGAIKIDGINIKDFSFHCLRDNITTIPQDVFLFTGNFYDNIALKKNISKEMIENIAKKICLHDFIVTRTKKYEENVLEEGKSLSAGQKQLLSFARAFIKDSPIVVLDEATSNIDSVSEKIIQQALHKVLRGKTSIIIAHRLSTIRNADRIFVMHHGKLVESGSHRQLMKKKNGIYRNLYRIQSIELSH